MRDEVLRMDRITRTVDGVDTLSSFNMNLFGGEVLGLLCVDNLGRKELIRLITHNGPMEYGMVYFGGKLVNSYQHAPMTENNVAVIDKHSRLVTDLTVSDNIFVLRRGFKKYFIQPGVLRSQLEYFTRELGISIQGDEPVSQLTVFEKCVVELLKAVVSGTKLVVVQDLSNILSVADLRRFQQLLHYYTRHGLSFLYICSHHEEAFSFCDRVAMMENGRMLRVMERGGFDEEVIWSYALDFSRIKSPPSPGASQNAAVHFENVFSANLAGLTFSVQAGECVVLMDVDNNTFGDMVELMSGQAEPLSGRVLVDGKPPAGKTGGRQAVSFVQQSPLQTMLYADMNYLDNLCFLAGEKNPGLWLGSRLKRSIIREYYPLVGRDIYETDIRRLPARALYSLVYYKVHLYNPKLAVCIQPFFGADMYLRHHILQLIDGLRKKGIAVLILAVNLSDSLVVADRLLLVQNGRLEADYNNQDFERFLQMLAYPPPESE